VNELTIVILALLFVAIAYWFLSEGSDRQVEGRRAGSDAIIPIPSGYSEERIPVYVAPLATPVRFAVYQ